MSLLPSCVHEESFGRLSPCCIESRWSYSRNSMVSVVIRKFVVLSCGLFLLVRSDGLGVRAEVRSWTTTEDLRLRMQEEKVVPGGVEGSNNVVIEIDPSRSFQAILGIGASFEHSTCSNLFRVSATERERVIERLVGANSGANMNLMRICVGTSDFSGED